MTQVVDPKIYIGTAGWAIPGEFASRFPGRGQHLERYARVLAAVEIDSTFYRSHRQETYQRWAASVRRNFRFAVKAPREITHFRRLTRAREPLEEFPGEARNLGSKPGPILFQLPPSLQFDDRGADQFFKLFR